MDLPFRLIGSSYHKQYCTTSLVDEEDQPLIWSDSYGRKSDKNEMYRYNFYIESANRDGAEPPWPRKSARPLPLPTMYDLDASTLFACAKPVFLPALSVMTSVSWMGTPRYDASGFTAVLYDDSRSTSPVGRSSTSFDVGPKMSRLTGHMNC